MPEFERKAWTSAECTWFSRRVNRALVRHNRAEIDERIKRTERERLRAYRAIIEANEAAEQFAAMFD